MCASENEGAFWERRRRQNKNVRTAAISPEPCDTRTNLQFIPRERKGGLGGWGMSLIRAANLRASSFSGQTKTSDLRVVLRGRASESHKHHRSDGVFTSHIRVKLKSPLWLRGSVDPFVSRHNSRAKASIRNQAF